VDLDEILYGGDGIEYYLDYILFNPVASTIPKFCYFSMSDSCFVHDFIMSKKWLLPEFICAVWLYIHA
jgi:hypothetical protein